MLDCIMLDIGGTFVKYSAVQDGVFAPPGLFPIAENGTAEEITATIIDHLKKHPAQKMAICMPGPADYRQGTMLMKHKFAAMYGICLRDVLHREFPEAEIAFVHDGVAYMLGEALFGAAKGCSCAAGVMLGTGLGFVLFEDNKVLSRSVLTPYMPLWNKPYQNGIAEEYVSGRGIVRRWLELGRKQASVKDIATFAREGDTQAAELMRETGRMLGEMLREHLAEKPVEKVVVGGQIAKSWDLMKFGFESACSIPACAAANVEDAALRGTYAYAEYGEKLLNICDEK